ncbi:apolipo protein O-domain-containing protein [Pseudoneurospora amorphoporcata]|uniref:MICOS complex subunit n=1 Tax=Pseudoneurospora amorphoporcata TaxID=241081 RepID=A0AAN6SG62_9PEZI|nr:apolipo protein O-domain-containing protein [Pseudoneurospora amorphoporcata]
MRAARATAAALVGSFALVPTVAFAEASESRASARKPIYDDDLDAVPSTPSFTTAETTKDVSSPAAAALNAPVTTQSSTKASGQKTFTDSLIDVLASTNTPRGPTPTDRLAAQIRRARLFLYDQACVAEDAVNNGMARAFDLEHSFTSTVAGLAPPRESGERLMPGLIYVLVSGMAGSIVARNRGIVLRGATPLALGLGAAWAVLPVTMNNVSALVWKYEQKFPAVANAHIRTREGIEKGIHMAKVHAEIAQHKVDEAVTGVRETVEGWVRKGK